MRLGTPFDALHAAMSAAAHRDLPDIKYWSRDWVAFRKLSKDEQAKFRRPDEGPGEWKLRRPTDDELSVKIFPQTWDSTALGYGGIGGSAMTPAYTIIVNDSNFSCVYFGCGRLAYKIDHSKQSPAGQQKFSEDAAREMLASCGEHGCYA